MTTYRVFRRGFNAANNPSRDARPEDHSYLLGVVEAADEEAAVRAVMAQGVTVYNGQGIWAEEEAECLRQEEERADSHEGEVLVKYWRGTLALEKWCSSDEEIKSCVNAHDNAFPVRFFDSTGKEMDYEIEE